MRIRAHAKYGVPGNKNGQPLRADQSALLERVSRVLLQHRRDEMDVFTATVAGAIGLFLGIILDHNLHETHWDITEGAVEAHAACEASLPRDQQCVMYFKPEGK